MTTPTKHFALEAARVYLTPSMAARGWGARQTCIVTNGNEKWLPALEYGRCWLTLDGTMTTVKHIDRLQSFTFADVREAVRFAEDWEAWDSQAAWAAEVAQ